MEFEKSIIKGPINEMLLFIFTVGKTYKFKTPLGRGTKPDNPKFFNVEFKS